MMNNVPSEEPNGRLDGWEMWLDCCCVYKYPDCHRTVCQTCRGSPASLAGQQTSGDQWRAWVYILTSKLCPSWQPEGPPPPYGKMFPPNPLKIGQISLIYTLGGEHWRALESSGEQPQVSMSRAPPGLCRAGEDNCNWETLGTQLHSLDLDLDLETGAGGISWKSTTPFYRKIFVLYGNKYLLRRTKAI